MTIRSLLNKHRFQLLLVGLLLLVGWLFLAHPSLAASDKPKCSTVLPANLCDGNNDIVDLINFVTNWLTGLAGVAAVIAIIINAFLMMSAGASGNTEDIKKYRGRIVNVVIGVAVLVMFRVILSVFLPSGVVTP